MKEEDWITQNTAMLVIHGIGSQKPLETLDQFARSLITSFGESPERFKISHRVAQRSGQGQDFWYENFIRIEKKSTFNSHHLDIYEYYWAHQTQDLATTGDINNWLNKVATEAESFYQRNVKLSAKEKSSFFTKRGEFKSIRYRFFLKFAARVIPLVQKIIYLFCYLFSRFPFLGKLLYPSVERMKKRMRSNFENIVGDIVVYNSPDAKSKFYEFRKSILDGAVSTLQYLLEPDDEAEGRFRYNRVIVAGHSLGSQISFDAINRITHHVSMENLKGYNADGSIADEYREFTGEKYTSVDDVLTGLITFGSPLDKIAFFLWEKAGQNQYLRAQILRNYHCFKQRDDLFEPGGYLCRKADVEDFEIPELDSPFRPLFDNIKWYNFYDRRDYVSGHLDFYDQDKVQNIDCEFDSKFYEFTHSWYWREKKMFSKIINDFLLPEEPPRI